MKIATLEINPYCGYHCEFCEGADQIAYDITRQEFLLNENLNKFLEDKDYDSVMIVGRDPGEYSDIVNLTKYLRRFFNYVILSTNGRRTGCTEILSNLDIDELVLNIYGDSEELHERFTHTMSSWVYLMNTIKNFDKNITIGLPVGSYNYLRLKETYDFIKNLIPEDRLSIEVYPVNLLNGDMKDYFIGFDDSIDSIKDLIEYSKDFSKIRFIGWPNLDSTNNKVYNSLVNTDLQNSYYSLRNYVFIDNRVSIKI